MRYRSAVALLLTALSSSLIAQSAGQLQNALIAQAKLVKTWMADAAFVDAVRAQNARRVPLAEIQRIDKEWGEGKQQTLSQQLMSGPCADRLRKLVAQWPAFEQAHVMDNQGTLVCATFKVDNYWQGERTNWQRAFDEGKGAAFVDRPRFDPAAGKALAQISVPVLDDTTAIGTITVGVDTRKLPIAR